jgi:hypothetical protein
MLRRLLVVVIVAACALPLAAQSLAEAARRAEEERKTRGTGPKITNRDLPGRSGFAALGTEFRLTDQIFDQYRRAWKEIMKKRAQDASIDAALMRSEAAGTNTSDLEWGYTQIPEVVEILDRHQLTVHTYWLVDAAFARAIADSKMPKAFREQMLPARADNITFVLNRDIGAAWLREIEPMKKELEERRRRATRR